MQHRHGVHDRHFAAAKVSRCSAGALLHTGTAAAAAPVHAAAAAAAAARSSLLKNRRRRSFLLTHARAYGHAPLQCPGSAG